MANINLLPEEMRKLEKKEILKAAKKSKTFTIDLSAGKKNIPVSDIKPSKSKSPLWSQIFGSKIKPMNSVSPTSFGSRLDSTPKTQKINYQSVAPKAIVKPNNSFMRTLGPAYSPVRSGSVEKLPIANQSFQIDNQQENLKVDFKFSSNARKKGPGFWSRFINSLMPHPGLKKPIKTHTKEDKLIVEERPVLKLPKKSKEKYNLASKLEKSKLNINLIPEELLFRKYPKSRQQIMGMILAIIIPTLMVTAGFVLIDQQQKAIESKIIKLNDDKTKLVVYINGFKDIQAKNIRLQDKLLAINKLLEKHVYWTKFFSLLERYTLDDVYYTEFTADTSGKFMLPAIAVIGNGTTLEDQISDSYRKAAEQITAFQKAPDFITQTKVNNLEIVTGDKSGIIGVKFEINLSLADGVFLTKDYK